MRILCFGRNGLVGQEIYRHCHLNNIKNCLFLTQSECDITDKKSVFKYIHDFQPTHVINCAAATKVDECETNFATANMINGFSLKHIAEACQINHATLLHFSTDYVFNGKKDSPYKENDPVNPINAYGESKQMGEDFIRKQLMAHYILRIQWVFGKNKPNFIKSILNKSKTSTELKVVSDQFGTPTSASTIAKAVLNLIYNAPPYGTYHFRSLNHTNWYEYAKFVYDECKIRIPVIPILSHDYSPVAKRPKNGILNMEKWIYSDLYTPPSWKKDVLDYLHQLKQK
jgi:dTDP-4-dehydrorhamnose reductase